MLLSPLDAHPWLREHGMALDGPTSLPRLPGWRLVAYSTCRRSRDGGPYRRRVWFRKPTDARVYGDHDWPHEAVHPSSLAPGRPSRPMGVPMHGKETR